MADAEASTGTSVARAAREVDEFLALQGWEQQAQLFALVPTDDLLAKQPELGDRLDHDAALTPVAQEALPDTDLAEALAGIVWPDTVQGCALAQEILVLPPEAEDDLPAHGSETEVHHEHGARATPQNHDAERLRRAAANHPRRTEARLIAAVDRNGARVCVMRLRDQGPARGSQDSDPTDEVVEHPDLAPNLLDALEATLRP